MINVRLVPTLLLVLQCAVGGDGMRTAQPCSVDLVSRGEPRSQPGEPRCARARCARWLLGSGVATAVVARMV